MKIKHITLALMAFSVLACNKNHTPEKPDDPDSNTDYVAFADEVLENHILSIVPAVDADGDGMISFEEAKAVTKIDLSFERPDMVVEEKVVTDLSGLEHFTSLDTLGLKYHRATDATPVEGLTELKFLHLGGNPIKELDLSKLSKLESLYLFDTKVSTLALDKTPQLAVLYVSRTEIQDLDLSILKNLKEVVANDGKLKTLKVEGLSKLERLDAVGNMLTSLEVKDCENLQQLHLNSNRISSIELSGLPKLMILNLYSNQLKSLDVSGLPFLLRLYVFDNSLEALDLSANAYFQELYVSYNPMKSLDLSKNPMLEFLEAMHMPALEEINLKNDSFEGSYDIVDGNAALKKVIVDAGAEYTYVAGLFKDLPSVSVVTE